MRKREREKRLFLFLARAVRAVFLWALIAVGLKRTNPILGYSDTSAIKLDFDNVSFKTVKYYAFRVCRWFKLKGFIIIKSSSKCYHVVFDRSVFSWEDNLRVMGCACFVSSFNLGLMRYLAMQCIKRESTLRLGNKGVRGCPRIVFRFGSQNGEVKNYLFYRRMVKAILNDM
jgi:hypothetical protein